MKKLLLLIFAAGSCLALLLGFIIIPQHVDAAGYSPAKLKVNLSIIHANKDCAYGANHGWICNITLQNTSTTKNLSWSASSEQKSVTHFNQNNGTLLPGQKTILTFFVANVACPTNFTLKFVGPINTVYVPWSCSANHLQSDTTDLNQLIYASKDKCVPTDYNPNGFYANLKCTITLTEGSNDQGGVNWTSSIKGTTCYVTCTPGSHGSSITPTKGSIISPSSLNTVTIVVPQDISCGKPAVNLTFTFTGPANKVVLHYYCTINPS